MSVQNICRILEALYVPIVLYSHVVVNRNIHKFPEQSGVLKLSKSV